jgi:hypothetical protein
VKLEEVREYALSLPEVNEEPHFKLSSFRVRGKILATVPPEEIYLHIFIDEQTRELAVSIHPEFCEKLWWGKKVVGVRVSLPHADPDEVKELLRSAWKLKAPKVLLKKHGIGDEASS